MHAAKIVARILGPCLAGMHAKRIKALQRAVAALLCGGIVSLSALALSMRAPTFYKHRLKSIDRLLGSVALQSARPQLYAALAARWLSGLERILLVVDWSDLTPDQRWQWLRASVVVEGRSVTFRLPLVANPGQCTLSRQRPVFLEEARVVSRGAVHERERAHDDIPHARCRGGRQHREGPDGLELVGVRHVPPGIREKSHVNDRRHSLVPQDLQEVLISRRLGEIEEMMPDPEGRRRGRDVHGEELFGAVDCGETPEEAAAQERGPAGDGDLPIRHFGAFFRGFRGDAADAAEAPFSLDSSCSRSSIRLKAFLNSVRVGTFMVLSALAAASSSFSFPFIACCMTFTN